MSKSKKNRIPAEVFVTRMIEDRRVPYAPQVVGFLHAHLPYTSGDAKKKDTQTQWAYGHGSIYQQPDGVWFRKGVEHSYDYSVRPYVTLTTPFDDPIDLDVAPVIWKNDPIDGFRVLDSVSRWSTSNKLWRIQDPRGAILEITTGCFEKIVMEATIIKGVIQDRCVWVTNKNLEVAK